MYISTLDCSLLLGMEKSERQIWGICVRIKTELKIYDTDKTFNINRRMVDMPMPMPDADMLKPTK